MTNFDVDDEAWSKAKRRLPVGSRTAAVVTQVLPFGLFATPTNESVIGTVTSVHFPSQRDYRQRESLYPVGSAIAAVIVDWDDGRRRLSLRLLAPNDADE